MCVRGKTPGPPGLEVLKGRGIGGRYQGVLVLVVVVLRPRSVIGAVCSMEGGRTEKASVGSFALTLLPPEKRPRTKDDDEDDWEMTLNRYLTPGIPHYDNSPCRGARRRSAIQYSPLVTTAGLTPLQDELFSLGFSRR